MKSYLLIVQNIFKRIFSKPVGVLLHIILPVAVSLAMIVLYAGADSNKHIVAVVDDSDSISSNNVLDTIMLTDNYFIKEIEENQIDDYITEGKATVAIKFDEDFEDRILKNDEPTVSIYAVSMSEGSEWIKNTINFQVLNLVDLAAVSNGNIDVYSEMIENLDDSSVHFTSETVSDQSVELSASRQMFGMYMMLSLISACTIAFLALKDKHDGITARIMITPTRASTYTIANITVNLIVQFTQVVLIIMLATYMFGMNFHTPIYKLLIILFTFSICGISVGQLITSISAKETTASAIMSLFVTPTCMIGGCFWPIEYMPKIINRLSFFTPQRWTIDAIKYAQKGEPIYMCLLVILSFSVLLYLISVYILKRKDKSFS